MNKETMLILTFLALIFAIAFVLAQREATGASDTRDIRIRGGAAQSFNQVYLEPPTVWVSKDTVVRWNNWARGFETRPTFEDDKKCQTAAKSLIGFELKEAKACFVSHLMPQGSTTSFRFLETGTYEYVVEGSRGIKARGRIVVR